MSSERTSDGALDRCAEDGSDGFVPSGCSSPLTKRRNYLVAARCHTGAHQLCLGINVNEGLFWLSAQEEFRSHEKWESLPIRTCEEASCGSLCEALTLEALEAKIQAMAVASSLELHTIEVLKAQVETMNMELEALRKVENAALAYVPYPAKTFDERHSPLREGLILALANVLKVRGDAAKRKGSTT